MPSEITVRLHTTYADGSGRTGRAGQEIVLPADIAKPLLDTRQATLVAGSFPDLGTSDPSDLSGGVVGPPGGGPIATDAASLLKLSRQDLVELATGHGIDVPSSLNKAGIVELILASTTDPKPSPNAGG